MGKLITTEVAVAYTNCPRKAFLLLNTSSPPPPHEYESICRIRGEAHRQRYFAQMQRDGHEAVVYDQGNLGEGHQCLHRRGLASGRSLGVLRPAGKFRSPLGFGRPLLLPPGGRRDVQRHR